MPTSRHDVVIVGAGQAGLAMSHCLSRRDIDHVILERHEVASAWVRQRWDSLRLLTPNWMTRSSGRRSVRRSGRRVRARVRRGGAPPQRTHRRSAHQSSAAARSSASNPTPSDGACRHPPGAIGARAVVLATGHGTTPRIPAAATALSASLRTIGALEYKNPDAVEDGGVLVVGASASGTQIADELARAGRSVVLAVGEHVRAVRSYRGHDLYWWLDRTGLLDERYDTVDDIRRVRATPSFQLVGSDDGRSVDLDALQSRGVQLAGRLVGSERERAIFSGSLANACASADLKLERLLSQFDHFASERGLDDLTEPWRPERTDRSRTAASSSERPRCAP